MAKNKEETEKISLRISKARLEYLRREYEVFGVTDVINALIDEKLSNKFKSEHKKSVISAIGGKHRLSKRLIELFPECKTYVEPFGCTASVLLMKPRSVVEVYNDINGDVCNFFEILRDCPMELYNKCIELPYSEKLFADFKRNTIPTDSLLRAVRFFYLSRASFLGLGRSFLKSKNNYRNPAISYFNDCRRFYSVSERFETVVIRNVNYYTILKEYSNDEQAFIFCDPPYLDKGYYQSNFEYSDFKKLLEYLSRMRGKWMVCHPKNEKLIALFKSYGYNFETIHTRTLPALSVMGSDGKLIKPPQELLLFNNYI